MMISPIKPFIPSSEMIDAARAILEKRIEVEKIRETVLKNQSNVLAKHMFPYSDPCKSIIEKSFGQLPDFVSLPEHSYMLTDADFQIYINEVQALNKAAGLNVLGEGHCPLLVANSDLNSLENELFKAAEPFTGITQKHCLLVANRKRYLPILLTLVSPLLK